MTIIKGILITIGAIMAIATLLFIIVMAIAIHNAAQEMEYSEPGSWCLQTGKRCPEPELDCRKCEVMKKYEEAKQNEHDRNHREDD